MPAESFDFFPGFTSAKQSWEKLSIKAFSQLSFAKYLWRNRITKDSCTDSLQCSANIYPIVLWDNDFFFFFNIIMTKYTWARNVVSARSGDRQPAAWCSSGNCSTKPEYPGCQCPLFTVHCVVGSEQCIVLCSTQCAVCTLHCSVCTV